MEEELSSVQNDRKRLGWSVKRQQKMERSKVKLMGEGLALTTELYSMGANVMKPLPPRCHVLLCAAG